MGKGRTGSTGTRASARSATSGRQRVAATARMAASNVATAARNVVGRVRGILGRALRRVVSSQVRKD